MIAAIACLLLSASCDYLSEKPPLPQAEPVPAAQISAWEEAAEVLFSDNFSDETSGWDTYEDEDGWATYHDGWLYLTNYSQDLKFVRYCAYSYAHRHFTDFIVEADTKLIEGSDNNWHDIQLRCQDAENFYSFSISSDGFFSIDICKDGEFIELAEPTASIRINKGVGAVNRMRIECIGNTFVLSVNGHVLRRVVDGTFAGGDIALAAHALGEGHTTIAFDNIEITGHPEATPVIQY